MQHTEIIKVGVCREIIEHTDWKQTLKQMTLAIFFLQKSVNLGKEIFEAIFADLFVLPCNSLIWIKLGGQWRLVYKCKFLIT